MGNLLSTLLQQQSFITFAAYKLDHPSDNYIMMSITTDGSKTVDEALKLVIKDANIIFNKIISK